MPTLFYELSSSRLAERPAGHPGTIIFDGQDFNWNLRRGAFRVHSPLLHTAVLTMGHAMRRFPPRRAYGDGLMPKQGTKGTSDGHHQGEKQEDVVMTKLLSHTYYQYARMNYDGLYTACECINRPTHCSKAHTTSNSTLCSCSSSVVELHALDHHTDTAQIKMAH